MTMQKIEPRAIKKEAQELLRDVPLGFAAANLFSGLSFAYFLFICSFSQKYLFPQIALLSVPVLRYAAFCLVFVLCFATLSPIRQRLASWYRSLAEYKKPGKGPLYEESGGVRSFCITVQVFVLKALWLILFMMPSAICLGALFAYSEKYSASASDTIYLMLLAAVVLLAAAGAVAWAYHSLRYFLCEKLCAMGKRRCVKLSAELMQGNQEEVFSVAISYLPQLISCLLILPCFFVLPRFKTAMALCADEIALRKEPYIIDHSEIE